ncbi:MAG: PQQ-dependent sugar dehydrogenase [Bacteroidota bacterium]
MNRMTFIGFIGILSFFLSCNSTVDNADQQAPPLPKVAGLPTADSDNGGIDLPSGFGAVVVADTLGRMRHIVARNNGDLYVKGWKGGIWALRDTSKDGKADIQEKFAEDIIGTGIDIYKGDLYASSKTEVFRFPLDNEKLLPGPRESIIAGFPEQGQHAAKSFTFDNQGNIYVNVGSPSNACQDQARTPGSPGLDPCPQKVWQAGIWRFDAESPGQTQKENGVLYASGIRNAIALDWNQATDGLFAIQHGRDQLHQLWPSTFTKEQSVELPAEEFLQIDEGDDFGWPFCFYNHMTEQKLLAPEYGGDGQTTGRCDEAKKPILGFPGHMAPNDLLFYTGDQFPEKYKDGAFIAFHGSWNRAPQPQKGYFVVFVPMKNGEVAGEWEPFAYGFPQLEVVESPSDAVYRPCGLAQGPDGSLYVADSQRGRVWRIMYYGS